MAFGELLDPRVVVILTGLLQAGLGASLAALFWHYHRLEPQRHLRLWAGSFLALAAYLVLAMTALALADDRRLLSPRTVASLASQCAAYLHIGWLALGTVAFHRAVEPRARALRLVGIAALLLATIATLAFSWDPQAVDGRIFARVSLRYLVATLVYLVVAWTLLGRGAIGPATPGQRLVAAGFLALALASALGAAASLMGPAWPRVAALSPWFGVLELAALAVIGLGLALWLNEHQRGRTDAALREADVLRHFDPGTGLPNRRALLREIAAREGGHRLVAAAIRPRRLRQLRDALGEDAVTALLQRLAQRLRQAGAGLGIIAIGRIEDDRLLVLASPRQEDAELPALLDGILAHIEPPRLRAGEGMVSLAAGFALLPTDAADGESLVGAAVSAQAAAEASPPGRPRRFDAALLAREREQMMLLSDLRLAMRDDTLGLAFQPVFRLSDGRCGYAETLLRWRHHLRGAVPPSELLEVVNGAGMGVELDRWVIERVARTLAARLGQGTMELPLAVNVSAEGFQQPDFPEFVAAALARVDVPARLLEIEITEAIAVSDPLAAGRTLEALSRQGICLALDDFGIGYSSLTHIKHLPVHRLKIDQYFSAGMIEDSRDAAIVRSVVRLGHDLGMEVVAEGIERVDQLQAFRREGADFGQGYLLSRPVDGAGLDAAASTPLPDGDQPPLTGAPV